MKNMKRFLALGLALTMSFSMAAYASAEETSGSATGNSYLEGVLPEDVVSVVLPTTTDGTYDFVLDPANLLKQYSDTTTAAKYDGSSAYFHNVAGSTDTYSSTSDIATAVNKSTVDVALGVDVTVTNVATNPVTFTASDAVSTGTDKNVYVGLVPTTKGVVKNAETAEAGTATAAQAKAVASTGKTSATFLVSGDKSNFKITQSEDSTVSSGHKYTYVAKTGTPSGEDATWNTVGFALTATCNTAADWTAFNALSQNKTEGENLKVDVAYSMLPLTADQKAQMTGDSAKTADATTGLIAFDTDRDPSGFENTSYTVTKGTALNIPVDLGVGTKALTVTSSDVNIVTSDGSSYPGSTWGITYDTANKQVVIPSTLSIKSDATLGLTSETLRTLKLTLNGEKTFTATLVINDATE